MHPIRAVIHHGRAALVLGCAALVAAAPLSLRADPLARAQDCFPLVSGIERLTCYDTALGRAPIRADLQPLTPPPPQTLTEAGRAALAAARAQLEGTRQQGAVGMTLVDRATGAALTDSAFDTLLAADADTLEQFRTESDLVLALAAMPEIGEAAILTVACRNRITELQLVWPGLFEGRRAPARVLPDSAPEIEMTLRIVAGGHVLEAPRGLEAIRAIRAMAEATRVQIAVGNPPRSAFFEMTDLRQALGLQARMCSWSGF